jgi:hypothetical protein
LLLSSNTINENKKIEIGRWNKKKKSYGQLPGCEVLVELVEPVAAVPELLEQLD